jgi:adenylate kinase
LIKLGPGKIFFFLYHYLKIISLIGLPGSNYDKYEIISIGYLLRNESKLETIYGKKIRQNINSGELVDDYIVIDLIKLEIEKISNSEKIIILDGFPRTIKQIDKIKIDKIIELDVNENMIIDRILNRLICSNCNKIYNKNSNYIPIEKNKCDKCKKELIRRIDDTEPIIKTRLKIYNEIVEPIRDKYKEIYLFLDFDNALLYLNNL